MSKGHTPEEIIDEIFQSLLATPKRQRKLRSHTFWADFGYKVRTKERVEQVRDIIQRRGIFVNIDPARFGAEAKDEWIVLSLVEPPAPPLATDDPVVGHVTMPEDSWFELMAHRVYESEREVEYYFMMPLIEKLGYVEDDTAIGFPVQMYEGVKKVNKEADCILFNGLLRDRDSALLVVEAKKTERVLGEDAVGQARAYAMWLTTPYYLVTNGDEIRLFLFRGAVQSDVLLLNFYRSQFKQNWPALYQAINKRAVVDYKARLSDAFADARALPLSADGGRI